MQVGKLKIWSQCRSAFVSAGRAQCCQQKCCQTAAQLPLKPRRQIKPIEIRVGHLSPNRGAPVFRSSSSPISQFGRGVGNTGWARPAYWQPCWYTCWLSWTRTGTVKVLNFAEVFLTNRQCPPFSQRFNFTNQQLLFGIIKFLQGIYLRKFGFYANSNAPRNKCAFTVAQFFQAFAKQLYFVSPEERPWCQRIFWTKTLVIAYATCMFHHASNKDWHIKDASCSVYL